MVDTLYTHTHDVVPLWLPFCLSFLVLVVLECMDGNLVIGGCIITCIARSFPEHHYLNSQYAIVPSPVGEKRRKIVDWKASGG